MVKFVHDFHIESRKELHALFFRRCKTYKVIQYYLYGSLAHANVIEYFVTIHKTQMPIE
jgi:hypothetical protein